MKEDILKILSFLQEEHPEEPKWNQLISRVERMASGGMPGLGSMLQMGDTVFGLINLPRNEYLDQKTASEIMEEIFETAIDYSRETLFQLELLISTVNDKNDHKLQNLVDFLRNSIREGNAEESRPQGRRGARQQTFEEVVRDKSKVDDYWKTLEHFLKGKSDENAYCVIEAARLLGWFVKDKHPSHPLLEREFGIAISQSKYSRCKGATMDPQILQGLMQAMKMYDPKKDETEYK